MKDSARTAAVAALAISAVAVVAATIQSTVRLESSGAPGSGGGGGGGGGDFGSPPVRPAPGEVLQIPFLEELLAVLFVLLVVGTLAYLYRYWRPVLRAVVALAAVLGVLALLASLLESPGSAPVPSLLEPGTEGAFGVGGGSGGTEPSDGPSLPAVLGLVALVAALVGLGLAYRQMSPADADPSPDEDKADDQQTIDAAAVGDAAGRAADRLEADASVDNEVYRAWREMTELLDVTDPETSTPNEFANAAVAAGMDGEDVRELTRLFEDVRYGGADPSAERERRAVETFRRIETQYAGETS